MSTKNSVSLNESLVFAHYAGGLYGYRRGIGMMGSAEYTTFMDDFHAPVTSNASLGWTGTTVDVGGTLTTYTGGPDNGGVIRITAGGATAGASQYRPKTVLLQGSTTGSTYPKVQSFFMEVRVRTALAADSTFYFGLSSVGGTATPDQLWSSTSTSRICFGLSAGSATPVLVYDNAGSGTQTDTPAGSASNNNTVPVLTNNTWYTLAIAYNGDATAQVGSASAWINGQKVVSNTVAAKVPYNVILSPFVGARLGTGGTGSIDFDYVRHSGAR